MAINNGKEARIHLVVDVEVTLEIQNLIRDNYYGFDVLV
jgi:hypothetical protein